jgi:hypothetical protein
MKTMLIFAFALTTQLGARQLTQAVWVYPQQSDAVNPVSDAAGRRTMVEKSAANDVTDLYVSVYQSVANSAGRLMYKDADIADLIQQAHRKRIKIWAAYGAPDWPSLGCSATGFPMLRMAEVNAYNAAHSDAEFDGVVLDVEPPEPADSQKLLALYQCVRSSLPQRGGERLGLAVAIRFFWDIVVAFPAGGPQKKVYEHIIDMELDHVVVMGYRDMAGTACPSNGIICLDQDEMAYADRIAENNMILVGVETSNCEPGCGTGVSFYKDGAGVLYQQAVLVAEHFRASRAFGGFAVHRYQDSYLGGIAGWPAVNNSR